jgi:hypothetical protein
MYKLAKPPFPLQNSISVIRLSDGASIPFDPANTDYQQYLKFLEEGGQPLPADDNGQTA